MHKVKIIRPIAAAALVLLFIVSNTPRQLLHNLFAKHTDCKNVKPSSGNASVLNTLRFHCACNYLVMESPFMQGAETIAISRPGKYLLFTSSLYHYVKTYPPLQIDLRGPPFLV